MRKVDWRIVTEWYFVGLLCIAAFMVTWSVKQPTSGSARGLGAEAKR